MVEGVTFVHHYVKRYDLRQQPSSGTVSPPDYPIFRAKIIDDGSRLSVAKIHYLSALSGPEQTVVLTGARPH